MERNFLVSIFIEHNKFTLEYLSSPLNLKTLHCIFCETHQGCCPLPSALDDIIAPRAAWLSRGWEDRGKGPVEKKVQPPTPPWSQLYQTTCHPLQPSHAILASPWANKDPFQASPYCDHAEQKQSVPLGCSLWSDPAFSLLQLRWFVQRSTNQADSAFWIMCLVLSILERAWRLTWAIP